MPGAELILKTLFNRLAQRLVDPFAKVKSFGINNELFFCLILFVFKTSSFMPESGKQWLNSIQRQGSGVSGDIDRSDLWALFIRIVFILVPRKSKMSQIHFASLTLYRNNSK